MTLRHFPFDSLIGISSVVSPHRNRRALLRRATALAGSTLAFVVALAPPARADAFDDYQLTGVFQLPGSNVFDVLGDGRIVALTGANVYAETAVGTRTFNLLGTLPNADFAGGAFGGPAFVRVSPDGTRIAVGNNGGASFTNYQVGVFDFAGLGGTWIGAGHYDGEWYDNTELALTVGPFGLPCAVTMLDTMSNPANPTNPTVVANINGSPAGIAFDAAGNLYTGNGYAGAGPSSTGWIKAFSPAVWQPGLFGGSPADFEAGGTLIGAVLSATALGFDASGNLHVGGGNFGSPATYDYAALVRNSAVATALAGGSPADYTDPKQVRRFDPDAGNPSNFYDVNFNPVTGELYVREGAMVYTYITPEPTALAMLGIAAAFLRRRRSVRPPCLTVGLVFLGVVIPTANAQSPFATRVVTFDLAPGQFVNEPVFDNPTIALGAPAGGGTLQPGNTSLVSLGGFGGLITLGFDHAIMDDPANPFGLDCIVFGNSTWVVGAAWRKWAECGSIEISRDVNSNGLADDAWYLIPGTHITDLAGQWQTQTWDDDIDDPTFPPDEDLWIPPGNSGVWTTAAFRLPPAMFETGVLEHPGGAGAMVEVVWGYADTSPTLKLGDLNGDNVVENPGISPADFYTRPDNPFRVGVTPGCGGGDAFDIAWAIDPMSGALANLDGFDFIRITTTANVVLPLINEKSTEVDGVADVAEGRLGDSENDGDIDLDDFAMLRDCWLGPDVVTPTSPCRVMDFDQDRDIDLADFAELQVELGDLGVNP